MSEKNFPVPYRIFAGICLAFFAVAFVLDSPFAIWQGFIKILLSRSALVSDYVALGGVGAALANAALSSLFFLVLLMACGKTANGSVLAGLWLTLGFSLFGKNILNTLPIVLGIWFYCKISRRPFADHITLAMMGATLAPVISEIAFSGHQIHFLQLLAAALAGLGIGFIFPIVATSTKRVHKGYALYNCGVAGGLIATFCVCIMRSGGVEILPESLWDLQHTPVLAGVAYLMAAFLIIYSLTQKGVKKTLAGYRLLLQEDGYKHNDFFAKYGSVSYLNMGLLCILATTLALALKFPINGPTLGGILTVTGFGALGKHPRNVTPILVGSIVATSLNHLDRTAPGNVLAIIFSTGLAPLAGQFGFGWGVVAGLLHVTVAVFVGQLNGGLNLYNNGFASMFVVLLLVPLIVAFRRRFPRQSRLKKP